MAIKHTEYRHICQECGVTFFSPKKRAMYDKDACKQTAYRKRKFQKMLERKFQLDMETFALLQQIIDRTPALQAYLVDFLREHDQDTFKKVLNIVTVTQLGVTAPDFQTAH